MPLMVIESSEGEPEFFNPCDTFKLCASHGDFSVGVHPRHRPLAMLA